LVDDEEWIDAIKKVAEGSTYVLTVCTGTALLARTGLLDGREATSNKKAFQWVVSNGAKVQWNKRARWVVDGKYYTSSGVTAGMDMSLGFIELIHGSALAEQVAKDIEYCWIRDKDNDSFVAIEQ
jgi:transcriptional regulator GlxA family with amidase domain